MNQHATVPLIPGPSDALTIWSVRGSDGTFVKTEFGYGMTRVDADNLTDRMNESHEARQLDNRAHKARTTRQVAR